jgi:hypothetical protein
MPFSGKFDDIYQLGIKPACNDAGAYCERVDEQIFTESILERVYNQIAKADIIVADMTGRNPNVFYETGYAHALNKRTILLTQSTDDIPFDLKHYPHIVYGASIMTLKTQLEKRVRWCVENPVESLIWRDFNLELYINESQYQPDKPIRPPSQPGSAVDMVITLQFVNIGEAVYRAVGELVIVSPEDIHIRSLAPAVFPSIVRDGQIFHAVGHLDRLLPGAWQSFGFRLTANTGEWQAALKRGADITVRVLTEFGPTDYHIPLGEPLMPA